MNVIEDVIEDIGIDEASAIRKMVEDVTISFLAVFADTAAKVAQGVINHWEVEEQLLDGFAVTTQ